MKILKILVTAIILIFAMNACNKDSDNSENQTGNEKMKIENPYDYLGKLHNEAMEKILLLRNDPTFDLDLFSLMFMKDAMKEMESDYSVEEWEKMFNETLNEYKISVGTCIFLKMINVKDLYFAPLKLTNFQADNIQLIFDLIENSSDFESIKVKLMSIETNVLQAQKDMTENAIILGLISIAKYSHEFWSNHVELFSAKGPFLDRMKSCLKADADGFVGGVVGGVIQGHAAVGMVFGPQGAVCALAADGTVGAIVGSGSALIVGK